MSDTFAKVVEVIEVRSTIGKGNEADPIRQIVQYFNFTGQLLAIQDPAHWYDRGPNVSHTERQNG